MAKEYDGLITEDRNDAPDTASRPLTVREWFTEIDRGLEYRWIYGLEQQWAELERMYYNVHASNLVAGPNIISSTGDTLLASLTVPVPKFNIKPLRASAVDGARVLESIDNRLVKELNMRRAVERAALSAYLWGVGFIKIGFDSEFGYDPKHDLGGKQPLGITFTQMNGKGERIEFNSNIEPGMPWVEPVLPHDIVVPWGCSDIDTAPWIAHRIVRHVDDVKADPKYENTEFLQPVMSMEDFVESYQSHKRMPYRAGTFLAEHMADGFPDSRQTTEYVELWEIHDRRSQNVIVIATHHEEFLRQEEDLLQLNNSLPFKMVRFTPTTRNFWVTPDSVYLKPVQAEMTDIALQASKQRRIGALKFAISEDALDPNEKLKATSGDVGVCFTVKSGHTLDESILAFQPGQNSLLYQEMEQTSRYAREVVGMSSNQMGEYDTSSRRTGTEAMIVSRSSQQRLSRRQLQLSDMFEDSFRHINSIIFRYWKAPRIEAIVGKQGAQEFIQFTGDELQDEYGYDVTFTSEDSQSLAQRANDAWTKAQLMMKLGAPPQAVVQYLMNNLNDPEVTAIFTAQVMGGMQGGLNGGGVPMGAGGQAAGLQAGGNGPGAAPPGQGVPQ